MLVGVGLYVLVALLWGVVESRSRQVLRDRIRDEGIFYASHLESELNFRMVSLRRMVHRWQMRGGTPRDEFMADAESYVKDFAGFRALAWVDKDFIIRWAIPREWEGRWRTATWPSTPIVASPWRRPGIAGPWR